MNIHIATKYAQQGYSICRKSQLEKAILIKDGLFVYEDGSFVILTEEDCLNDDWQIITNNKT